MRIVIVGPGMIPIPPPGYGAVEKHIWNLAEAVRKRGHDVEILNDVVGPTSKDEYRWGLRAHKRLKQMHYDVLHVHTPGVATILSLLGPRAFVFTSHSRHWMGADGLGPRIGFYLERKAVQHATEVIALTPDVASRMGRKATVVTNGVDVDAYVPHMTQRTGRVAVSLGELAPHKKWHLAAAAAQAAGYEWRHVGPQRDKAYAEVVQKSGGAAVKLLGPLSEEALAQELARADVMIHPSVSENLPMAVLEGMSSGLPIACSDFLGNVVEPGKQGFLVPTDASDERRVDMIRRQLEKLSEDPTLRQQLGEGARAKAVLRFSWGAIAEQVELVYARAAKTTRR